MCLSRQVSFAFPKTILLLLAWAAFGASARGGLNYTNYATSGNPAGPAGPNDSVVIPKGEYAPIDTKPIEAVMFRLKATSGYENDDLVRDIEKHSGNYAPPVFFALANLLYRQGKTNDAIFWFNAGLLRGSYDAARCADVSARDAISIFVRETPVELRQAQFADDAKLQAILQQVIEWDRVTPYHYEYRWINLHGMNAMQSGLGHNQADTLALSEPESTWPALAKKNRDDYEAGLEKVIARMEQKKAEGIVSGAPTNSVYDVSPSAEATGSAIGAPGMTLKQTINFGGVGSGFGVRYLAFSPDGRYLAVLGSLDFMHSVLIIWDVTSGREQSRISDIGKPFGTDTRNPLVWAPDDSYITLAAGRRKVPADRTSPVQITLWNPLKGEKIRDVEVSGAYGSLNLDGTRLAMISGTMNHIVVRIYDTVTWTSQDYSTDGLNLIFGSLCWTPKGKVVVVGSWDRRFPMTGLNQLKSEDVLAREFDPSGKQPPMTVLLAPSIAALPPSTQPVSSLRPVQKAVDNRGNKVAVGEGAMTVFDGDSLKVLFSYAPANLDQDAFGEIAFSPDGKYLYIEDTRLGGHGQGVILDAQSGKKVGSFPKGTGGFSVSSIGRLAALGDEGAVKLFVLDSIPK
jgi:WD40 repeat protein